MRKTILWVIAAVALVAIPAVIGLVTLRGEDSSSEARRAAALVAAGAKGGASYQLVLPGITPSGQAIDVMSYSWGVKNAGGTTYSGGTTAGKATFNDLVVTKLIDQTSGPLAQHVANGKHLPSAVLTLYRATSAGAIEYTRYTLTDVIIGSVEHTGNADAVPTEQISLNYVAIKADVSTITGDGTKSIPGTFSWNISTNAQ